ncbi:ABC transporter substrate-binding protein [Azospira restricta]|uniref:ABC transporter substrate-binding protein n=1 Tax=Azospira restricta TaxID=404405 RepID=A0A974PWU1_9RHOO|nr:ABC transporter substrate-binding protein [Azospira restricta]QRJ62953.1 ABC transporter substrate-binding protein [Azospira restricta]
MNPSRLAGRARGLRRLAAVALLAGHALAASAADIVVGQVAPLTGVLASTGRDMVLGAKIWFDHVNAGGGVNGSKIRHIVADDGYQVAETVRLTKELIDKENAVALIGFAGTANVGELQKRGVLEAGRIALVAPYTGGEVLRAASNRHIFHIRAGYADEAEHMVDHLVTLGVKKIAVFYQNDGFGEAGKKGVEAALAKRELKLAAAAGYERNTDDVAAAVATLRQADVGAIIMISVNRPTAAFARSYRAAGGSAQLFNISVVDAGQLVKLAPLQATHGLGISQVMPFPYSDSLPVTREFKKLFARYAPADAAISYTNFEEFIGAKVLVEAIRRAGANPTPEKVVRALETLGSHDVGGFSVSFSPDNRIGSRFVEVTVIGRNGNLLR